MRAIAEEAFAMVKDYKGSHSGEHGDGLVRSEFHEKMYGRRTVEIFEEVKDRFDPGGLMNPGKIVRASAHERPHAVSLQAGLPVREFQPALDWSAYPGAGGGFQGAVEMCNNNGECRKHAAGVMCPSFRVTGNERDRDARPRQHLRLAISGQLGADAFASDEMLETMKLCVSCKGCRRECPTGVDMAKMKIEVLAAANQRRGLSAARPADRLPAALCALCRARGAADERAQRPARAGPAHASAPPASPPNARSRAGAAMIPRSAVSPSPRRGERVGVRGRNDAPEQASAPHPSPLPAEECGERESRDVALFADTFNTYFEPDNLHAAVNGAAPPRLSRDGAGGGATENGALCCGRTFLSAGLVEEARAEARRVLAAAAPILAEGGTIVGLEPSCLLTLRDEFIAMLPGPEAERLAARSLLLEEFLAAEAAAGRIKGPIASARRPRSCCTATATRRRSAPCRPSRPRSASSRASSVRDDRDPAAAAWPAPSATAPTPTQASLAMGELSLLPAVRKAAPDALIAADGFSCRHQIHDGTGRAALHVSRILSDAIGDGIPA